MSDQKLQNSSVDHSSVPVNQTIAVGAYNEEDRSNAHIEENVLNPTIDAAFGINSGGYEPDEASKNLQEETSVLEKAMELFKSNKLQEAKAIYERILGSRRLNHANSHNTQAARFIKSDQGRGRMTLLVSAHCFRAMGICHCPRGA